MKKLSEILLTEENRPKFITDCEQLLETEIKAQKGVKGLIIKTAFKTLKGARPGAVKYVIEIMLDDIVAAMEPNHAAFEATGQTTKEKREQWILSTANEIADDLLGVTDKVVAGSDNPAVKKIYGPLRKIAKKPILESMPNMAKVIIKYF